jgi:hypothetical protein
VGDRVTHCSYPYTVPPQSVDSTRSTVHDLESGPGIETWTDINYPEANDLHVFYMRRAFSKTHKETHLLSNDKGILP